MITKLPEKDSEFVDVIEILRFICEKLSVDKKITFKLEDIYSDKYVDTIMYRLYKNNNPTRTYIDEETIIDITTEEDLFNMIENIQKSI